MITLYHARLGDAMAAYGSLNTLFCLEGDRSLMMGTKLAPRNAYEMDYNTGATAAIAEMLLQSHLGTIHLLPALPAAWPQGEVKGLCARGGFRVDLAWQAGKLTSATLYSPLGGPCRIRATVALTVFCQGQVVPTLEVAPQTIEFVTTVASEYRLQGILSL